MAVEGFLTKATGLFDRLSAQLIPPSPASANGAALGVWPGNSADVYAAALNAVFREFSIDATVAGRIVGPSVVLYKIRPGAGVKAEKITGLSGNLNLALRTERWRMLPVVPGEPYMGIEVPRPDRQVVPLPPLLAAILDDPRDLLIPIGVDVQGRPVLVDLAILPHVLIAGATGAGKSELLRVILCSLLARVSPDRVRLLLIDPKRVELTPFRAVPHLIRPVVTDPVEAVEALEWLVTEMERRYRLLERAGAESIATYRQMTGQPLARLVVVVDELANLIGTAGDEAEAAVIALGELARAAGIHLVLATQRPSVDVIKGRIKANMPARLALMVASLADSRVILDGSGAQNLIGRGDALFTPDGRPPTRVQGALVTRADQQQVLARAMSFAPPHVERPAAAVRPVSPAPMSADAVGPDDDDGDELLVMAAGLVVQAQRGSTSMLQRKLRLGYARAGRLMDDLEVLGVVGPADGAKPRDVLVKPDDLGAVLASIRSKGN